MIDLRSTRHRLFLAIVAAWLLGATFVGASVVLGQPKPVVVTHWANGHLMSDSLLPAFAKSFNAAHHTTASGARVEIRPVLANSGVIKNQLINRFTMGGRIIDCS